MLSRVRAGKFTSSQIYKLMLKGRGNAPSTRALDYIEEIKIERKLRRGLNSAASSRPTIWGHVLEPRVACLLGEFEYQYVSDQTLVHPTISDWAGTPDLVGKDKVGDIKCPYTLKSFAQLVDSMKAGTLKTTHPEYFWQLVSNAILTGKSQAELIVYCPYERELDDIRENIGGIDDTDLQTEAQWIVFSRNEVLPYLLENKYYSNINRATFAVDASDKQELSEKVEWAVKLLQ